MYPSVFIVDFEEVSAGWEAKEGLDYKKEVDSSAGAMWSLNNGSVTTPSATTPTRNTPSEDVLCQSISRIPPSI